MQTVHNAFKSSLEEILRVDANTGLELLDHEQHTQVYVSVQEYSNPECESEDNTAKDHRKTRDSKTLINESKMGTVSQTVSQNSEPVYHQPNNTQGGKPTGKQSVFDHEAYEIHAQASKGAVARIRMDSCIESKSHFITSTVKEEISTVPYYSKRHTQNATTDTHFYHSLEKTN